MSDPEYEDVDSEVVVETETQPATPDAEELMREHYHEIRRQAIVCGELGAKYLSAKEDWSLAQEALAELINSDALQRKLSLRMARTRIEDAFHGMVEDTNASMDGGDDVDSL